MNALKTLCFCLILFSQTSFASDRNKVEYDDVFQVLESAPPASTEPQLNLQSNDQARAKVVAVINKAAVG